MGLGEMFLDKIFTDENLEKICQYYLTCVECYLLSNAINPGLYPTTLENFCRQVEEGCEVLEMEADDFRRQIFAYFTHMGSRSHMRGIGKIKPNDNLFNKNPTLLKAIKAFVVKYPEQAQQIPSVPDFLNRKRQRTIDDPWEPQWKE